MADIVHLPTAAAEPVINPNRCRSGAPPRNVTKVHELVRRRRRRAELVLGQTREQTESRQYEQNDVYRGATVALVETGAKLLTNERMKLVLQAVSDTVRDLYAEQKRCKVRHGR